MSENNKKGFVFYHEWADCISHLKPNERLGVYDAIVHYARTGEVRELRCAAAMALNFVIRDMERDAEKYEKISEARRMAREKRGGLQNATKGNKTNAKEEDKGEVKGEDKEEDKEKINKDFLFLDKTAVAERKKRKLAFVQELATYLKQYPKAMIEDFCQYWTEPEQKPPHRMRFEQERTWSTASRLHWWARHNGHAKKSD